MKYATRLNSFVSETGDVAAALREIAATGSIKYVDLNYPEHFVGRSVADMRQLLDELGLTINSVAMRFRKEFIHGEYTNRDREISRKAIELTKEGIDATADARAELVPPLLLQPLVENAIHHGLECKVKPGSVQVLARVEAGHLHLCVQDDGVGLDAPQTRKGSGVATQNIRDRLRGRYGSRATFKLEPASPEGTRAIIDLPLTP